MLYIIYLHLRISVRIPISIGVKPLESILLVMHISRENMHKIDKTKSIISRGVFHVPFVLSTYYNISCYSFEMQSM